MCCRKILVVVFMLIIVIDATPLRSKKRKITSEAVSTKKYAITYTNTKQEKDNNLPNTKLDDTPIPEPITPVNAPTAKNKQILHKSQVKEDKSHLLVKPLEIDGVFISGINNWFVLDDPSQISDDMNQAYYEYYEEYTEEFWNETVFEYDSD